MDDNLTNEIQQDIASSPSVSKIAGYKPILLDDNLKIICSMTPAKFDNLVKVISNIAEESSPLVVKDGLLLRKYYGGIVCADVSKILDESVNLQIIDPRKQIKLLKSFRSNNDIYILDDPHNMRFVLTNGEIKIFLPKADMSAIQSQISPPDLSDYTVAYRVAFDKNVRSILSDLMSKATYVDYLIQDDVLKGVYIPNTAIYIFNDYINDPKATLLDETTADFSLRSTIQFPQTGDNYELFISKSPHNNTEDDEVIYYLVLTCSIGYVTFVIYEMLEVATGNNIII